MSSTYLILYALSISQKLNAFFPKPFYFIILRLLTSSIKGTIQCIKESKQARSMEVSCCQLLIIGFINSYLLNQTCSAKLSSIKSRNNFSCIFWFCLTAPLRMKEMRLNFKCSIWSVFLIVSKA